jgi:hypothetical protein
VKDVLAYAAGATLVAYVGYIFIASDDAIRVNRACIPAAAATKLLGAVVRIVDEDSGESVSKGKPQQVLSACRNAVWYWAKDSRNPPPFPEEDALFGTYVDKSYSVKEDLAPAKAGTEDKPTGSAPVAPVAPVKVPTSDQSAAELDKALKAVKAIKSDRSEGGKL